jgi:hypothetical protein
MRHKQFNRILRYHFPFQIHSNVKKEKGKSECQIYRLMEIEGQEVRESQKC